MSNTGPVIHFEMPYEDKDRMADFYTNVFGWEANKLGEDYGNYVMVMTSETDEKTQLPKKPGMVNGGFFQKNKDNQYPSVVIGVEDIYEAMKQVKAAGGTVLGGGNPDKKSPEEPDDIPGVGLYSAFIDTEGNRVGMMQSKPQ